MCVYKMENRPKRKFRKRKIITNRRAPLMYKQLFLGGHICRHFSLCFNKMPFKGFLHDSKENKETQNGNAPCFRLYKILPNNSYEVAEQNKTNKNVNIIKILIHS